MRDALAWAPSGPGRRGTTCSSPARLADRDPTCSSGPTAAGVRVALVTEEAAAALSDTVTPQGVVAVCDQVVVARSTTVLGARRSSRSCAGVADPGNAGTVVRAGRRGRVPTPWSCAGDTPSTRTTPSACAPAMGSLFHVPLAVETRDVARGPRAPARRGAASLAADGRGETELDDRPPTSCCARPAAWVFGSEAHGLAADRSRRGRPPGAGARSTGAPRASTWPPPPRCASTPRSAPTTR